MTAVRIVILLVTALMLNSCSETKIPLRRGAFAFHYSSSLTEEQLQWYSRFDILVTHDPLPRDQVKRLRRAGTKLVLYEWSVAFYDSLASDWQRSLSDSERGLLNRIPLTAGVGSATAGAWYFDPATSEHEYERALDIARRIEAAGYDGVFFDTTTFESVHPLAREEYQRRHPETSYDAAFSRFLSQLRRRLGVGIIFTNQGYRSAEHYLSWADWDLTESLVTRPVGDSFAIRPWNDANDPWTSSMFLLRTLIEPAAARYPNVRFGHLNYAQAGSADAILLVQAVAQLFGDEGFVAVPSVDGEMHEIYFRDPGTAVSERVDAAEGKASYRFFTNGLIAINASPQPLIIENPLAGRLRNHVTGELSCERTMILPASEGPPRAFFFDVTSDCND